MRVISSEAVPWHHLPLLSRDSSTGVRKKAGTDDA